MKIWTNRWGTWWPGTWRFYVMRGSVRHVIGIGPWSAYIERSPR